MIEVSIRPGKDVSGSLQGFAAARDAGVHVLDGLQESAEGLVGQPRPRPACMSCDIRWVHVGDIRAQTCLMHCLHRTPGIV